MKLLSTLLILSIVFFTACTSKDTIKTEELEHCKIDYWGVNATLITVTPYPAKLGEPIEIYVPTSEDTSKIILDTLTDITITDSNDTVTDTYSSYLDPPYGILPRNLTPGIKSNNGWTFTIVPENGVPGRWWIQILYNNVMGFEKQLDGSFCVIS
jgi:hypothetical protein